MEPMIFAITNDTLKESRKNSRILTILMPVIMALETLILIMLSPRLNTEGRVSFIIFMTAFTTILLIGRELSIHAWLRKLSEVKLILSDKIISRVGGGYVENINLQDIKKIVIIRKGNNQIKSIKLYYYRRKMELVLFEHMDLILTELHNRVNKDCIIIDKKSKINWDSTSVTIISCVVAFLVIMPMVVFNLKIMDVLNKTYPFIIGLYCLIFKPMSTSYGERFAPREFILSCILIILGLLRL